MRWFFASVMLVSVLVLTGCGSSGGGASPQPSITGAAGNADSQLCFNLGSGSPGSAVGTQQATVELQSLYGQWAQAYDDYQMGDQAVTMTMVVQDAANADAWCSANGFAT